MIAAPTAHPTPSTTTDLSIVIVSWNVYDYLAECLESLRTGGLRLEVLVIDSASSDSTPDRLAVRFPWVRVLAQPENVGFTRGSNIGLAAAGGRLLMLLNPDTRVLGDALSQMAAYLDAHPEVGIVGPHTLNTDGSHQSTRRRFPTLLTAFFESTWLQQYAPRRVLDHFYVRDAPDDALAEVDWVQGSALMLRREVYDQIGGLDEGYIMFSEELDWCRRARAAGWKVAYLGGARIIHHGGKSTEQASTRKHVHFQQSKIRYFRKFHGRAVALLLRFFLIASYAAQIGIEATKALLGSRRPMRLERVRSYGQVIRALLGPV